MTKVLSLLYFMVDLITGDKSYYTKFLSLISKKAGRIEKLLGLARSHYFVTCGSVSLLYATTPHPSCFSKSKRLKFQSYSQSKDIFVKVRTFNFSRLVLLFRVSFEPVRMRITRCYLLILFIYNLSEIYQLNIEFIFFRQRVPEDIGGTRSPHIPTSP